LRASLARYLAGNGVPRHAADDVLLAADEAYINAFMHSGDVEGEVAVHAEVRAGRILLEISDGGCGFQPDSLDVWSQPDPLKNHGRGLFLIHHLMDDVHVRSSATGRRGTCVRMVKDLRRHPSAPAQAAT
jgi:anti-sigma regulatory factor (Ser/Thr protein kinase)